MKVEIEKVLNVSEMGEGTRVEVDFIDTLSMDEGILVGNTSKGYFRILAENRETDTYPARPFRVNAGAIHQYIYLGDGKTKYLSELKAGDQVFVTDGDNNRKVTVGRIKIEKREFVRVETISGVSATIQKADSVFIAGKEDAVHLIDITDKDCIYVYLDEIVARHKGNAIEEEIVEK